MMKSLSALPKENKPPIDETEKVQESGDGSIFLLAFLLSKMDGDSSDMVNGIAQHVPGGEKLRLALKFGSELKRCGGGLSSLKVVARYTKNDLGSVERAIARSEQLRETVELMRSKNRGGMDAILNMAGINPMVAAMLKNQNGGGLSPEMLMSLLGMRK